MADKAQNFANHGRFYPVWHFVAFPILLINVIVASMALFDDPSRGTGWRFAVAVALLAAVYASRTMNLMTQDRIIRGEERARLKELLPADMVQDALEKLTPSQLIGLRFASDGELPELTKRVLDGELTGQKEIKQAVRNWRGDHMRV